MKPHISAPSNIALIKYMGKVEGLGHNRPTNASLSYTLDHLRTYVELEPSARDSWSVLKGKNLFPLELSPVGLEKFLGHLGYLKETWEIEGAWTVRSANNFPSDCGLASSASSFAALTKACAEEFQKHHPQSWGEDPQTLSRLSRRGSGSSCRSFFSPWALWREEGAEGLDLNLRLLTAVVVLEQEPKKVSSSQAHKRVLTSARFEGRIQRAEQKLSDLISALKKEDWRESREIIWDEFWDMHELFHTSQPGFGYMTPLCRDILEEIQRNWKKEKQGPWVTLDAGPNLHFLFRLEDRKYAEKFLEQFRKFPVIKSWESS